VNGSADEDLQDSAAPVGAGHWEHERDAPGAYGIAGWSETTLWTLLRATVSLHSFHCAEDMALHVADVARRCLDAERIVVCDRESGADFRVLGQWGADAECQAAALDATRRLAERVVSTAADPSGEADSSSGTRLPEHLDRVVEPLARTSVCVPMQRQACIAGAIYATRGRPASGFGSRDLETLRLLAAHAAIVLENLRLQAAAGAHGRSTGGSWPAAAVLAASGPKSQAGAAGVATAGGQASPDGAGFSELVRPLKLIERDAILAALQHHKGNRTAAASALRISVRKLQYRIKQYQREGFAAR
jgi:transcriptional regulator with GAF, ATPase, and Fis domain